MIFYLPHPDFALERAQEELINQPEQPKKTGSACNPKSSKPKN
jgi:hypothetical protein